MYVLGGIKTCLLTSRTWTSAVIESWRDNTLLVCYDELGRKADLAVGPEL